jgi:Ca-activated chloride channel family protein
VPEPLYLPFAYRWHCKPAPRPVDVALIMDMSSSMTGEKLDAARRAAGVFLGFLDLRPGPDRGCLVSFDNAARLVVGLTVDRNALAAGLAGLANTPGTRIDLGMDQALQELLGAQARADADRAIVILTDGLPMPGTEAGALAQGERARAAGVETWAIGLGADVDPAFLALLAGTADHVLVAPAPSDLEAVYRQVASGIICR